MALGTRDRYAQDGPASSLATLASNKNPDGTDYSLPISGSVATVLTTGATPTPVASGIGDSVAVSAAGGLRLVGCSARSDASGGNTAKVILRNGNDATDPIIAYMNLQDDQSETLWFGPEGIACADGVFVDRDGTNAVALVLYTRVAT